MSSTLSRLYKSGVLKRRKLDGHYQYFLEEIFPETPEPTIQNKILQLLQQEDQSYTCSEISEKLGIPRSTISPQLTRMIRLGEILRTGPAPFCYYLLSEISGSK